MTDDLFSLTDADLTVRPAATRSRRSGDSAGGESHRDAVGDDGGELFGLDGDIAPERGTERDDTESGTGDRAATAESGGSSGEMTGPTPAATEPVPDLFSVDGDATPERDAIRKAEKNRHAGDMTGSVSAAAEDIADPYGTPLGVAADNGESTGLDAVRPQGEGLWAEDGRPAGVSGAAETVQNTAGGQGDSGSGFQLTGPLPVGTTVLEASAGTGKTYAIVGLAVRFVAEAGVDISELLLVTFSRAATQELRERTRDRFVSVAAALADPERAQATGDELIRHLAQANPGEVAARRERLLAALSDFDAGTIATTHSFCQRMLDELGLAGEQDPGVRLVESIDDVVSTVADDLYLSRYAREIPPFGPADARRLAAAAVGDGAAILVPEVESEDDPAGERVAFAAAARAETARRKQLSGLRDFDDLLVLLHDVLADDEHGPRACQRIRDRFRVALVDEFQDTDPLQWDILRRAFHGHTTLVLVGDPKQAIYAFRGAEVLSYLDAVAHADSRRELTTNRRSDAGLLAALEHIHGGAALGHKEITVHTVAATRPFSRLTGAPEMVIPFRLRCLPRTGAGPLNRSGYPTVGRQRERVATDVAADIVRLLESGTTIDAGGERPLGPGDIAVLVRNRNQLDMVRKELELAGVASVLAGGASVFGTPSATQWLWVLHALEQPHRADRVRLAAGTALLGLAAEEIDSGGADLVGRLSAELRDSARLFARAGFAAVFEKMSAETELAPRLLALERGERQLTDLRQIAQLLDDAALREGLGLSALTRWLADRVRDPASGSVAGRSRRLDRDAAAVQIATVHASKGLEFPVVYLPFAWDAAKIRNPQTLLFHDEQGRRVLDVGGPEASEYSTRKPRAESEEAAEELRLLYVALTRAGAQVVAWWAPAFDTQTAPLHRMILGREPGSPAVADKVAVPADSVVLNRISEWASTAEPGVIAIEPVHEIRRARLPRDHTAAAAESLAVARFDRRLDQDWRRTSYSALTAGAHDAMPGGDQPDGGGVADEPTEPSVLGDELDVFATAAPSLMNTLPYGAEFGTLVHEILEYVDTDAPDLAAEMRARCTHAVAEQMFDADPEVLAHALMAVMRTPIGFGSLADISARDRLSELDFDMPLAGGDTPTDTRVSVPQIAGLLRRHLPADDVFLPYADQIAHLDDTPLRGFLTGSIDAVLRTAGPRFVVVDYKTNRLGTGDLTVAHYTHERMAAEMMRSHYPLQAILYSVALHRYLRWRLPGYDPARHLGGIRYLFVRGMIGPDTPDGCGVFDWMPPPALVTDLSLLLAGELTDTEAPA
ncbi:UvrD-helicase domain-containing protein [Nocardia sp. NBC_01503]|uniref:UvrD-helicase domain-containing protein n=1 Tax=Nocardia sp. NBC_01503 TaxID=2975997 RepID=UPI002E7C1FF2|nr:UvrD-helicase domain-containing protein [Nocardia sp. NBC_01503]WTL31677.1 UvrD-helicase domain-containing protein [Nocardia sp. NBC_01503]